MSIGIDFILRANSAQFTRAMATANNSVKDFKRSLREGDIGGSIKAMIGGAGVIAAFKSIIGHAVETRRALEDMGKSVPNDVNGVAKLADALADLKDVALTGGTAVLGFFTKIGDGIGNAINAGRKAMGAQLVDPDLAQKIERGANAQEEARDKARKKAMDAGSRENLMRLMSETKAQKSANDHHAEGAAAKLNRAIQDRVKLEDELSRLEAKKRSFDTYDDSFKSGDMQINAGQIAEKKAQIEKARAAILTGTDDVDAAEKAKAEADKHANDAQRKLRDFKMDRFLAPDVETLAGTYEFGEGSSRARSKAIHDAQNVVRLQGMATSAADRGDIKGAMNLQGQADSIRQSLSGYLRSDAVDKGKDLLEAVNLSNEQLKAMNEKLNGLTRAN